MEAIKAWAAALCAVTVFAAVGESILPSGNLKKLIRIVLGLLLVIAVCRPIVKGEIGEIALETGREEAFLQTNNMEEKEREAVLRLYRANLAKNIENSLCVISKDARFEVSVSVETQNMEHFGKIRGVTVTVITNDEKLYLNDEIERIIDQSYGVEKKNIAIKYAPAEREDENEGVHNKKR